MQSKDLYPYYRTLETLVKKGQSIPLALYEKDQLASALRSAKEWKEGTAKIFLKKVGDSFLSIDGSVVSRSRVSLPILDRIDFKSEYVRGGLVTFTSSYNLFFNSLSLDVRPGSCS